MSRRNIQHNLQSFKIEEEHRKEEQDKNPGTLFIFNGIGRKYFGRAEYLYDPKDRIERFKTTIFVVLFWLPLIPTGTFLVERKRALLSGNIKVLQRFPLNWEQVMKVWIVAGIIVLALIWAIRSLPRILLR
ncbi:MAG TPA: hypothetical protein VFQ00_14745 [Terriglobales bacterium]|nr:hypothetical protein [Terriglobales bacterium]